MRKRLGVKIFRFRSINLDLDAGTFQINGQNLDLKSVTDFKLILGQMGWEIEVKQNALALMYEDFSIPTLKVEEDS